LGLPGVTMTDIDDTENRLRIGVQKLEMQNRVEKQLINLGIPLEAVIFEEAEPDELALQDFFRPLVGGLQIAWGPFGAPCPGCICTIGFLAVRPQTPVIAAFIDTMGFVTNSHCTITQGGNDATSYYQPNVGDTPLENWVGLEVVDPLYFTGGECDPGKRCRYSDSAFVASIAPGIFTAVAQPQLNAGPQWDITMGDLFYFINGIVTDPMAGETVEKVGRTTGRTQGTVRVVCADRNVDGTNITLLCQNRASYLSRGGDSGAPVMLVPGTPASLFDSPLGTFNMLYGINYARTTSDGLTSFSPIANVLMELGPLRMICIPGSNC
jgi:hypothetical protein